MSGRARTCVALAAALTLAGCAAGGPAGPTPPLDPLSLTADAVEAGPARLALSRWGPEGRPRAIILALHGYGDYAPSTFDAAARAWAEAGVATYAYDQRGFGRNADFGRWPGADRLIGDAVAVAAAIRRNAPGTPLFVLGLSMGGGVALAAAAAGLEADGLILVAPAVWGGDQLALPYRALAWAGAALAPDKRWTGEGVVEIRPTDNDEVLRRLSADPLVLRNPSSREFMGLIRVMDRAVEAAPGVDLPVLALYGARDEVTPKPPLDAVVAALPGETRYVVYPEGWHLLLRDLQAPRVWADIAGWIEERT